MTSTVLVRGAAEGPKANRSARSPPSTSRCLDPHYPTTTVSRRTGMEASRHRIARQHPPSPHPPRASSWGAYVAVPHWPTCSWAAALPSDSVTRHRHPEAAKGRSDWGARERPASDSGRSKARSRGLHSGLEVGASRDTAILRPSGCYSISASVRAQISPARRYSHDVFLLQGRSPRDRLVMLARPHTPKKRCRAAARCPS